ncbi:aspartyl-tRNA(Asn)/glutamyl-tRNA(Gln) amidotransferase subunit B [Catalinimonas alkaloidigena]|uniref:Aspartyl/glutamyl-tRNA(Asn/Gln) amidotransferase subunit B n=1 Tax=Catalinimonas alkaloidigena TaxID=1075417 RepID=A0A1G9AZ89_9BACT|nr:Asp-tRNA(Asn)/Glu-tRNA(Gln) amidotransferase subunit GatB [Catalinimonas alkaloidigena]SDK32518.1 aspartyl-tRNA(Asn)/glutamyl-tRNA(Gln) amidotransferase subunit B [Catalinimonas alkaloidigena]
MLSKYEPVIGLEVHCQLLTASKAFAADPNASGGEPNTHISVITLAHPGALPRTNRKMVEYAIRMGLACGSEITRYGVFARKNYFYPDLPKGYQISQEKTPICQGGQVVIRKPSGEELALRLHHIHMEEDAGKSIHLEGEPESLLDYNRAGVPLIEVVSDPEMRSAEEAVLYLQEVRRLVRYLDICDGNLEEGSFRCDANVSVRLRGETKLGQKVEIKNMNSFRNVQRAIDYEIERQIQLLEKGEKILSETRLFDANTGITLGMRTKEAMNDYRYFPEPDLAPLQISETWLNEIKASMPALPQELYQKFTQQYGLPAYDAGILTESKEMAFFFEEACQHTANYKGVSNWLMGPVQSYLNATGSAIDQFPLQPSQLTALITLVDESHVSYAAATQQLLPAWIEAPQRDVRTLAEEKNLWMEGDDDTLQPIIATVLERFPDKVKAYRKGKKGLIGLFMGEVMKATRGKADPKKANELLTKALSLNE